MNSSFQPRPWSDTEVDGPLAAPLSPVRASGSRIVSMAALIAGDVVAVALVVELVRLVVTGSETTSNAIRLLVFACAVQIVIKAALGAYPGFGLYHEARLRKGAGAWLGACLVAIAAALFLSVGGVMPLVTLCFSLPAVIALQAVVALIVRRLLSSLGIWGVPVQLAGNPAIVQEVEAFLRSHPEMGLRLAEEADAARCLLWADRALPEPATLASLRRRHDEIILVSDLPRLRVSGVHPTEHGGQIGLRLSPVHDGQAQAVIKRSFDLVLSVPAMLVAAPILLIAALLIRVADPGPAFFVQPREGQGGRRIGVFKLRTMYCDAEKMLAEVLAKDEEARAEWEEHFKLRKDPRILPVIGKFLRATSLDELPQLLNIVRGEMSFVGPRPFPEYHLLAMSPEFRAHRASVVPGLTGLWQISERSTADIAGQQQLDEYYIAGRSFWGDLSIFLRTFAAVIGGKGAY